MSTLFIGARHLHLPVLSVLPILHGFLLFEEGAVLKTFSGDRGRGRLRARLDVYEADYSTEHPDSRGVVALPAAWTELDAITTAASFRATLNRIDALNLTYNSLSVSAGIKVSAALTLSCNCNTVITTLILQAGLVLPPPPALFLPGYGRSLL